MKLKTISVLLILGSAFTLPLRPQSQPLNTRDIERLADYVTCELTAAYLENYVKAKQNNENFGIIDRIMDGNSIEQPIPNDSLSKLLNIYGYEKYSSVLLDKLAKIKSDASGFTGPDSALINILLNDTIFKEETKIALKKAKESLRKELKIEIAKIRRKNTEVLTTTGIINVTKDPVKSQVLHDVPDRSPGDILPYVSLAIALGALALSIIAYWKAGDLKRHDETIAYERNKFRDRVDLRFDTLDRRTRTLESDFIELREKQRTIVQPQRMDPTVVVPDPPKTEPLNISSPWLYLSSFNEDGSFERSSLKSEYSTSTAKYKVKIDAIDKAVAEFEFCGEGTALSDSLSNPDKYLKPLCRINPSVDYNSVKRIVTDKRGKAELRGDRWIVEFENKAIITLL